jgi:hypothetical protein
MFVQIIQGRVSDPDELRSSVERWIRDISPNAVGWLGSTSGVTDDGIAVSVVRFESEEAARANSNRPEQHAWWMDTAKLFTGDVTFHDSREVYEVAGGPSGNAGFVQIIQGRSSDRERSLAAMRQAEESISDMRPDILGGLICTHDEEGYTNAFYFTSEAEARVGEQQEPPEELKQMMEEEQARMGTPTFYDLRDPKHDSPRKG